MEESETGLVNRKNQGILNKEKTLYVMSGSHEHGATPLNEI